MGRIYNNLKRIKQKIDVTKSYEPFQSLIEKFITLVTYEDTYLMQKLCYQDKMIKFVLKNDGDDIFINCINFGIIVDKDDKVSIHTQVNKMPVEYDEDTLYDYEMETDDLIQVKRMGMHEDIESWYKCWVCGSKLIDPTDKKMTSQRICINPKCYSHEGDYA